MNLITLSKSFIPGPFLCVGCEWMTGWTAVCESCFNSVRLNPDLLESSHSAIQGFAPMMYSFSQNQRLIRKWKARPGTQINRLLLRIHPELVESLKNLRLQTIVAIPQVASRSWKRGHASATTVAANFSRQLKIPVVPLIELRDENVRRQASLSQAEREFAPNPFQKNHAYEDLKIDRILLVDDLITSGNTLVRAAETLQLNNPTALVWAASLAYRTKKQTYSV